MVKVLVQRRPLAAGLLATLCAVALAACGGGGSDNAASLLKQTFGGKHTVDSGRLQFAVSVDPSGSTNLTSPLSVGFGGPFQSRGVGKLPASNFNLTLSGLGRSGSVGILSTGSAGYVTLSGTSYQLPVATFQKLESSFASVAGSSGGTGKSALSRLGINPLQWLTSPTVIGHESVAGAPTTHIRAGIDLNAFLGDLNTLLQRASSLGVTGASTLSGGISTATRQRIAGEVHDAQVDVWTGTADRTLRRLSLHLTIPVTGQTSTLLGGLKSAAFSLNMQYASLNQPQQISAPAAVRPYAEFQTKLQGLLSAVQSAAASGLTGGALGSAGASGATGATGATGTGSAGATGTGSAGATGTGTAGATGTGTAGATGTGNAGAAGTASGVSAYDSCLQTAGTDVTKMQSCASLLSGK